MTPVDQDLDLALLFQTNPLDLYRLTKMKYASLSGKGAALAAGRWNDIGEEAIYTSIELATTVLERLVHTPKETIPSDLALLKIKVAGNWIRSGNILLDRSTSASLTAFTSLADARKAYSALPNPAWNCFAIALPSVVIPAWNVILYPQRVGFWNHVTLEAIEPFTYDPRLFPEHAVSES